MSFTIVGVAGKALRLCAYVVPGYFFASYISDLASTVGSVIGFLAAGALAVGLGIWLWRSERARQTTPTVAYSVDLDHIGDMIRFLIPLALMLAYGFLAQRFALARSARMLDQQSQPLNEPRLAPILAALAAAQGIDAIRLHLLASDAVNGLAAADGRIFLTRGFHRRLHSGEVTPDELASVVAHELGHVALGHSRRRMIDATGQNAIRFTLAAVLARVLPGIGPWLAGLATNLIAARLSQRDEFEADAYAAALLTKAGIGTGPQKSLLTKLTALTDGASAPALAWLASHPETRDRVAAIEALERRWGTG